MKTDSLHVTDTEVCEWGVRSCRNEVMKIFCRRVDGTNRSIGSYEQSNPNERLAIEGGFPEQPRTHLENFCSKGEINFEYKFLKSLQFCFKNVKIISRQKAYHSLNASEFKCITNMSSYYQSKNDISSACSEIFEYLLKKTYEEENPFVRFADAEVQMYGPNTLENSLAIEEREHRDYTTVEHTDVIKGTSESDILYMKDASSSNSVNVGSDDSGNYEPDEERRCYTQQCLCGMICNNLKRCIQSVSSLCMDDEAFDNEYLEMLRSFNDEGLVTDTDSDRYLPFDNRIHGIPEGLKLNNSTDPSQLLLMARSNPDLTISKEDFLRCMCGQGDIKCESLSRVYDACAKILSVILTMNTLYLMKYVVFNLVYRNLAMN